MKLGMRTAISATATMPSSALACWVKNRNRDDHSYKLQSYNEPRVSRTQ